MATRVLVCALVVLASTCASQPEWAPLGEARPDLGVQAEAPREKLLDLVAGDGLLWLLDERHALTSYEPADGRAERHLASHEVIAIHGSSRGSVWAVAVDPRTDDNRLFERRSGEWKARHEWSGAGSEPTAVTDIDGRAIVVTGRAVLYEDGGSWKSQRLIPAIAGDRIVAAASGDKLYVGAVETFVDILGFGGLYAVDLGTGAARVLGCIGREQGQWRSEGFACLGVRALLPDPAAPGCVYVAFNPSSNVDGSDLARTCGERGERVPGPWDTLRFEPSVEQVLDVLAPSEPQPPPRDAPRPPGQSPPAPDPCELDIRACYRQLHGLPIFGLLRSGTDVVAVTSVGLVTLLRSGPPLLDLHTHVDKGGLSTSVVNGIAVVDAPPHVRAVQLSSAAAATDPRDPSMFGCYRIASGEGELCLEPSRLLVRRREIVQEAFVSWQDRGEGMFDATVGAAGRLTVQRWGDTLLVTRREGRTRFGFFAVRRARP